MSEQNDNLIIQCREGDTGAFRKLMEKYQTYVFSVAFRFLCNEEDARDIVQETFIRIWKHIGRYNFQQKFTTWLYTITTRLCFDKLRNRKRQRNLKKIHETEHPESGPDIEKTFQNREIAILITRFAEELTPKQRMVFILRDLQDLTIQEVSGILNMPVHSVKSNLYYARKNIRTRIEKWEKCHEL